MPRVILNGSPQCQWDICGHMKPGGTVLELSDEEIKQHKDVVLKFLDGVVLEQDSQIEKVKNKVIIKASKKKGV